MIELKPKKEEDFLQEQQPGQEPGQTSAQVISGPSATAATGVGASKPAAPKTQGSGNFTNLQNYLALNKDQNFGQQVAGKVDSRVGDAAQAQQQAESAFKQDVDQGSVKYNEDLVNRAVKDPTNFLYEPPAPIPRVAGGPAERGNGFQAIDNASPVSGAPVQKPSGDAQQVRNPDPFRNVRAMVSGSPELNQQNLDDFAKQRDATYKGSKQLADRADLYQPTYEKTDQAQKIADKATTESGRLALLDDFYARPSYSGGQKKLDNLLMQNDPNSRTAFAEAKKKADTTSLNFENLKKSLADYAGAAEAGTAEARAKTRGALGIDDASQLIEGAGSLGQTTQQVMDALKSKQDFQAQERAALSAALANKDISKLNQQQRDMLGVGDIDHLYNVNLSQYLNAADPSQIVKDQVVSPEQQAKYAALTQLAGIENTFLPYKEKAGTLGDLNSYNSQALRSAIQENKASYDRQIATVQNEKNAYTNEYNNQISAQKTYQQRLDSFNRRYPNPKSQQQKEEKAFYQREIEQAKAKALQAHKGLLRATNAISALNNTYGDRLRK